MKKIDYIEGEKWCDIDERGIYKVSNMGRVGKYYMNSQGLMVSKLLKFQSHSKSSSPYVYIVSKQDDKKIKGYAVNQLIAKAFVPNPNNLPYVGYKNGDRTDNRAENLFWTAKRLTSQACRYHHRDGRKIRVVLEFESVVMAEEYFGVKNVCQKIMNGTTAIETANCKYPQLRHLVSVEKIYEQG